MKPSKVKDLIPSFAMEIERPVDEVSSVIAFYYKKVRSSLSGLKATAIQIENLGSFYIKERMLDNYIKKSEEMLSASSNKTISEYAAKVFNKERLDLLKSVKEQLNAERERRRMVINKRFNTITNEI